MKNIFYLFVICLWTGCTVKTDQFQKITPEAPLLKSKPEGYFKAVGTEPFWRLEISEERIRFQGTDPEDEFTTAHVEPVFAMDAAVKTYRMNSDNGEMIITIYRQNCSDQMSDQPYGYRVDVDIRKSTQKEQVHYSGCGNYTADYRLFDLWLLEEVEGRKVSAENFTGEIPLLEINASEKKFSGYGGCNRISGTLFQERERLRFTDIRSTKMACGAGNMENVFLKALQSSTGYKIKHNRLYLINPDGIKVILKKVD